ncbi:MAG: LptE family protein [Verrucomicrobiota bacterium]
MNFKNFGLAATVISFVFIGAGCSGYRLGNIGGKEIQGVRTVCVPVVKNEAYEPGLQVMTTNAIIRRFEDDGTLQTVKSLDADGDLSVTIKKVQKVGTRSDRNNVIRTAEYELEIIAEVTFTNRRLGRKIFENKEVRGKTAFYVQNDLQEGERQSLPLAAEDLANNIVKLVVEGW